jgi:AraC-like DNA-binding protein
MGAANDWLRYRASGAGLDWAEAAFRAHRFSPHRHDSYAVGITTRGVQCFRYRGAARQAVAGEAFVLHPDELHDGGPGTAEGLGYRILYLDPALVGAALGGAGLPFVAEPVSRAAWLTAAFRSVFPDPDDPRDPLREVDVASLVADALWRAAGRPPRRPLPPDPALRRLREQLAAACVEPPVMAELERAYGRSRFALARQFRRAFGVSPSRFVTLRRLDRAQRLIGAGHSLAEAAVAAGFADQAHLTRQFRAAYGTTPGRWRALLRAA